MAYIRVGQVLAEVEIQSSNIVLWRAMAIVEVDEDTYAAADDSQTVTSLTAYAEISGDGDSQTVTSVAAYAEITGGDFQTITSVAAYAEIGGDGDSQTATSVVAYVETAGDASRSVTSLASYVEFFGGNNLYSTSVTADVEILGDPYAVSATNVNAYLEVEPPSSDSTYTSATSVAAYVERSDEPSEIIVSKVIALLGVQDSGASVSQFSVYVEYTQVGLYATHFGVLVEVDETETNIVPTYFREKTAGPQSLARLPEEVVGYALDPSYSFWQIVVPEETINLVKNPSFEVGTYNYNAAEIANWTRVAYPSVGSIAGRYVARRLYNGSDVSLYYGEIEVNAAAGIYTFSCWVHAPWEFKINLRLYDDLSGVNIAHNQFEVQYTGWHRYSITGTAPAFAELRCYLEFEASQQTTYIYTDAWQLERKGYATTYCDGDMVGFYEEHTDYAYSWTGVPHQSNSIRRDFTRSGGRIVSLSDDIRFLTTSIIGLGMSPIELDTVEMTDGSEIYRGSFLKSRRFTITGRLYGNTYRDLMERRALLVDAVKPDTTQNNQPLLILYAPTDKTGDEIVAPVEIQAAYQDGLTGSISNFYTESIPLQFYATLPEIRSKIRGSAAVTVQQEFGAVGVWAYDLKNVSAASGAGTERGWHEFGGGVTDNVIYDADWKYDGKLLVCGAFHQIDGSAIYNVAEWDPGQAGWYSKSVGTWAVGAGPLYCCYGLGPSSSKIFVFEAITAIDAVSVRRVAVYDENTGTWDELANGLAGIPNSVGAIVPVANGDVYVFGDFATDGPGIRTFGNAVQYDASADDWVALPRDGLNDVVWDAALGPDGNIYLCGDFTDDGIAGGGVSPYATRYNVSRGAWEALGSGIPMSGITGGKATKIAVGPDGSVYVACGFFAYQIWRWNGASWSLHYEFYYSTHTSIDDMAVDSDGNLHLTGSFPTDSSGNSSQHDYNYIVLSGNVPHNGGFSMEDYELSTSPVATPYGIEMDQYGRIALFKADVATYPATAYQVREITTVTNSGSTSAYPLIKITGPGKIRSIRNHTVDADIQFRDDFVVQEDETVTIDLTGVRPRLYSNIRERVQSNLLAGVSSLRKWRLLPGENEIEALMLDIGVDTEIWLEWQNTHWSIDPSN